MSRRLTKNKKHSIGLKVNSFFQEKEALPIGLSNIVGMDCEMIEASATVDHPVEDILCRVSIIGYSGKVLLDEFVYQSNRPIKDYRTDITGVDEKLLRQSGKSKDQVISQVKEILKDKIVVGHGLNNDFDVLGFNPKDINCQIRDTASYKPIREAKKIDKIPSLKSIVKLHLNKEIQTGVHSSVEDARCALAVYKMFAKTWEVELKPVVVAAPVAKKEVKREFFKKKAESTGVKEKTIPVVDTVKQEKVIPSTEAEVKTDIVVEKKVTEKSQKKKDLKPKKHFKFIKKGPHKKPHLNKTKKI
jgi:DNA polymerase III epsilon subunit-like protein